MTTRRVVLCCGRRVWHRSVYGGSGMITDTGCFNGLPPRRAIYHVPFSRNHRDDLPGFQGDSNPSPSLVTDRAKWQIFVAVALERFAVVSPERTQLENEYAALLDLVESERSHLSPHELWQREHENRDATKDDFAEVDALTGEKVLTPVDYEYQRQQQKQRFEEVKQSRITEADKRNDQRSLERELDRKLVLTVKQRFGTVGYESPWILPQTLVQDGETLRESADRLMSVLFTCPVRYTLMGNAPVAVHRYAYSCKLEHRTKKHGSLIFIHRARLHHKLWTEQPDLTDSGEFTDLRWLTHDELLNAVRKNYAETIKPILLE